jgi:hypothetical protein
MKAYKIRVSDLCVSIYPTKEEAEQKGDKSEEVEHKWTASLS